MREFLNCNYAVISILGSHAGESEEQIFSRKILDIKNTGQTFWMFKSNQTNPVMIQNMLKEAQQKHEDVYCIFIKAASKGGTIPTKTTEYAKQYSNDNNLWVDLHQNISPVTGKIDKGSYGLVFDNIEIVNDRINLWDYCDYTNQNKPLKIRLGGSTLCAVKKDSSQSENKIKTPYRDVAAVGKLSRAGCVWLR